MDVQTRRAIRVDLSSEADFRLGPVTVFPSTRQLVCDGKRATLEPRVMQLLVVLADAKGDVVSRDELVLRCWDGVVVGENAINRVVSLLRAVAAETCGGAFRVETIKKVGYRLLATGAAAPAAVVTDEPAPPLSRRAVIGSGAAVVATGAVGALFLWRSRARPPRLARELFERGGLAQRQGLTDQTEQAIAFFTEAIRIDPDYADAWGALAISYRHKMVDDPTANADRLGRMIVAAADRALALDPGNADAHVAPLLSRPTYRHWVEQERAFRAMLERFPDHWLLRGSLGRLMYDVGRWSAGVPLFRANVAHDPFLPVSRISLAEGLWGLGRLQEAEQVYREALERWPKHFRVWLSTFRFLALSGQPEAALALAGDEAAWPPDLPAHLVARNIAWARALASGKPDQAAASVEALSTLARDFPDTSPPSIPVLAALGATDEALLAASRYFDPVAGSAPGINPKRRAEWRETAFLFSPPLAPLRSDPRFAELTARIGLADYWRATRTAPDPARG